MDFANAVKLMHEGVSVQRTLWDRDEYIYLSNALFYKQAKGLKEPLPIIFFAHDVLATDWEVRRIPVT